MRLICIFIALIFFGADVQAQQAWTQNKGEGYFQLGSSFLSYDALLNGSEEQIEIPRPVSEMILSLYGEYGLTNRLTASFVVPFMMSSNGDLREDWVGVVPTEGSLNAIGNVGAALTYKYYDYNGIVLSTKLGASLNTITIDDATGLRTGYDAYGVTPSLLAGIGTSNYFASAETGVNFLTNGYLHRYIFNAQIGKQFLKSKRLILIFAVSISHALGESTPEDILTLDRTAALTGLYVNEQSYYAGSLKLGYELSNNWSIWTSASGGAAKNVGSSANYYVAIGYKLKKKGE